MQKENAQLIILGSSSKVFLISINWMSLILESTHKPTSSGDSDCWIVGKWTDQQAKHDITRVWKEYLKRWKFTWKETGDMKVELCPPSSPFVITGLVCDSHDSLSLSAQRISLTWVKHSVPSRGDVYCRAWDQAHRWKMVLNMLCYSTDVTHHTWIIQCSAVCLSDKHESSPLNDHDLSVTLIVQVLCFVLIVAWFYSLKTQTMEQLWW